MTPRWSSMVSTAAGIDAPVGAAPPKPRPARISVSSRGTGGRRLACGHGRRGPGVVRLAAGRALDGVDHIEPARQFVAGDAAAAVLLNAFEAGSGMPGPGRHDGRHGLAPTLVGCPAHDGVHDVGMRAYG